MLTSIIRNREGKAAVVKVFVTGASGFIGSRLTRRLAASGAEVLCHVLPAEIHLLPEGFDSNHVVSGGAREMRDALERIRPDCVVHLASVVSASDAPDDVARIVSASTVFAAEVAHAAARSGVPAFVNVGSYWAHSEGTADLRPNTLYAAAKLGFEPILNYYAATSGMRVTTLELCDTYGPGDTRHKFLDLIDEAAQTGKPLEATRGEQIVSLVHVADVCDALTLAAEHLASGADLARYHSVFDTLLTLQDVVLSYERATRRQVPIQWGAREYAPHQVMRPFLHAPVPGWSCRLSLEQGLEDTYGQGVAALR